MSEEFRERPVGGQSDRGAAAARQDPARAAEDGPGGTAAAAAVVDSCLVCSVF